MAASPIIFVKGTTPATPSAGKVALYVDTSGVPHYVDETGADSALIDPTAASAAAASASASEIAAAASASAAASSKAAAESAADVAQLSAGVYPDTAAGLAATTSGQYFSVPSADSAEYLILYKNNAGSAVEVKRYPSADRVTGLEGRVSAIEPLVEPFRYAAESGALVESFQTNTPITVTNLSDAATSSQTYTYGASALTINLTTGSRTIKYSTKNKIGGKKARVTLTQVMNTGSTTPGVGFAIGAKAYYYTSNGRVTEQGVGDLVTTAPTFTAPVTITTVIDIDDAGNMAATWSHAGGSASITRTGVSMGDFALIQKSVTNVTHSAVFEALGSLESAQISTAARAELTADDALNIKALMRLLSNLQRAVPVGMATPPYSFRAYKQSGARAFFSNIDLRPLLVEGDVGVTTVYVDPVTGSDSNAGTSAAPYKSLSKAVTTAGSKLIVRAKPGLYDKDTCWAGAVPTAGTLQVVPWGDGDVISSTHHSGLSWTLASGSATYSATIVDVSSVADVAFLTADGDYSLLALVASQAEVDATPNSYFVSGTTIYVRTQDSRAPDANVRVYRAFSTLGNGRTTGDGLTTYMERIKFHGGSYVFYTGRSVITSGGTLLARQCDFKYAGTNNLAVNGAYLCVLQSCVAAHAKSDGFNYHAIAGSSPPTVIEVQCIGRWNGRDTAGTNNGSTIHEAGTIIRVNGDYHHNQDSNVHDIGGSLSWNIGCTARDSQNPVRSNFCAGVSTDGATVTKMWLDGCNSSGTNKDLEATGGKGTIYTSDFVSGGNNVTGSDIQSYQA